MMEETKTKIIIFEYYRGWNDKIKEEFEFDIDADEEEIQQVFEDWVWELIGDKVHFYEKE